MAAVPPKAELLDSKGKERLLTIADLLTWLVEDKMVGAADAEKMKKERRYYRGSQHPLSVIADQKWKSTLPPNKPLTLEPLTEWLAKGVPLGYRHIDPPKIDFRPVPEGLAP